jgi:nicotinate-nucleotide--dimethylbenzimidazole phosphoribosyltransferase
MAGAFDRAAAALRPVDMRLGEGTEACLAVTLVEASARILREMATFDATGVTAKDR